MAAYYNEIDPYAAQWLRNLIDAGLIADGVVDERSILDVEANDLAGFSQCHFFAGLGGWSRALRLAGWPDDRPVWTGSPPCQPFSTAGLRRGKDDERHLAPTWLELISECRPAIIFGEQVEAAIRKDWLDDLQVHLESESYAVGSTVLPACSVGAPHLRQRLWIVAEKLANAAGERLGKARDTLARSTSRESGHGTADRLADGTVGGQSMLREPPRKAGQPVGGGEDIRPGPTNGFWRAADWLYCRDEKWRAVEPGTFPLADGVSARVGRLRAYGNAIVPQVAAEVIKAFMEYSEEK